MNLDEVFAVTDIGAAINEMRSGGAACVRGMLRTSFRKVLLREVIGRGAFVRAAGMIGPVRQDFERFAFLGCIPGMPVLESLRVATETMVKLAREAMPQLAEWRAMDTVVQKYSCQGGLGSHRDLKRHPDLIAIYTISGSCLLELLDRRDGNVLLSFSPGPGDLILLRGWIAGSSSDARPFHRVSGNLGSGSRVSVTFRDNDDPTRPIEGFSYGNVQTGGD